MPARRGPDPGAADLPGPEIAFVLGQTGASHLLVARRWRDIDLAGVAATAAAESGAKLTVIDGSLPEGDPARLGPPPERDDEVRWIFYTSGTTADPKGAMHTDVSASAGGAAMASGLDISPDDRIAMVFPIAHIGGCAVWFTCSMLCGAVLIFTEYVDPDSVCDLLRTHRVTIAGTGPAHHAMYIAAQRAHPGAPYFPDVRVYTSGGAAKPPSHFAMIARELGRPVHSSYGMTEGPILTCTHPDDPEEVLAGSEGGPSAGVQLRIVDGEVRVKGPQVMRGYLDSSLDADAFDDEGWLRSGDLGRLDAAGNLTITGRIKDVIIRKGETFSAREVEDLLITAPGVADVAVIGLPHPVLGEQACACVVAADPSDPPTLEALTAHLAEHGLMRQKWPERLQLLDSLPRNLAGKVIKADLKTLVA